MEPGDMVFLPTNSYFRFSWVFLRQFSVEEIGGARSTVAARGRLPYRGMARSIMSVFQHHRDELEHYETMMGPQRGRLAVTLDLVTNAMVLVGQHGVYCHAARGAGQPALDLRAISRELTHAKELIQSVMEELKKPRGAG